MQCYIHLNLKCDWANAIVFLFSLWFHLIPWLCILPAIFASLAQFSWCKSRSYIQLPTSYFHLDVVLNITKNTLPHRATSATQRSFLSFWAFPISMNVSIIPLYFFLYPLIPYFKFSPISLTPICPESIYLFPFILATTCLTKAFIISCLHFWNCLLSETLLLFFLLYITANDLLRPKFNESTKVSKNALIISLWMLRTYTVW